MTTNEASVSNTSSNSQKPAASFAPPQQGGTPSPRHSCFEIGLIILATVMATIIIEIILAFLAINYIVQHVWQNVQQDLAPITGLLSPTSSIGGLVQSLGGVTAGQSGSSSTASLQSLSSQLTPAKMKCLENALGTSRIQAIISGQSSPSLNDLFNARNCL